jgi:hypothetical protein
LIFVLELFGLIDDIQCIGAIPLHKKLKKTEMKTTAWNTYRTCGYTYDVANDQRSAGGVHHYQIRRSRIGWQKRIAQSNGSHTSYGPVCAVSDADGAAAYAAAFSC